MDRARDNVRYAGTCALVAGAHGAGLTLAYAVNRVTSQGVPIFPAAGVTVAALLLAPRRWWPGLLAATFASELVGDLLIGEVGGTAIGSALSNTIEPLVGAALVLRVSGSAPKLSNRHDLFVFLAGGGILGPTVGAAVGVASTRFTPGHLAYFDVYPRWFTADALGVLVVGSLVLGWAQPGTLRPRTPIVVAEGVAVLVAVAVLTTLAFWGTAPVLAYTVLPPLVWAATRFGVRGATATGVVVAVIADWATIEDRGLFAVLAGGDHNQALWHLQLFLAVVLTTALLLAAQVAARDEVEQALRLAEERQRVGALLESSPDPILVLRDDSTVEFCNEQLLQLVGRSREELLGRPLVSFLDRAWRQRVLDVLAEVRSLPAGSRSTYELRGLAELLDLELEAAVSPLETMRGRFFVATIRDVAERNAKEAALRAAVEAAEVATKAKADFLATMSHEIRTPMSAVTSLIELLDHTDLDAEQQSLLATMRGSSAALLRIIDDTLDFSKIESGMLRFESVPLSIADEMRTVASLMEPAATSKGITLRCTTEPAEPPAVQGDPVRIRQVLLNLVGNAVKFTSVGGVELEAAVRPGPDAAVDVTFTVRDSGIGIDPDRQADLFRPFTQAEHSTTRLYGGTGLGLSIVSRLVELMRGSIEVESTPGAGSTFVVRLCLDAAAPGSDPGSRRAARSPSNDLDRARLGGHVVLVAEDNAVNRDVVRRQLALVGCGCDVVDDGGAALDRLERGGVSLLLTDRHMPVLDGLELARRVRERERGAGGGGARLPMVGVTANALDGEAERCLAAGMDACLTKPVDLHRLAGVLAELLPEEPVRPVAAVELGSLREIVGDDGPALAQVLGTWTETVAQQEAALVAALDGADGAGLTSAAHRIAGAAATVGAARLVALARVVELAPGGAAASTGAAVEWVRDELGVVREALDALRNGHG